MLFGKKKEETVKSFAITAGSVYQRTATGSLYVVAKDPRSHSAVTFVNLKTGELRRESKEWFTANTVPRPEVTLTGV